MKRSLLLVSILICGVAVAQPIRRALHPAISPDGKSIAFSWQGDIWTIPTIGGQALRLTIHPSQDQMPRWTPDGKSIVFSSSRFGNFDLFVMASNGANLRRLTFDSSAELMTSVSPDGQWVYGTTDAWGRRDLFKVSIRGGDMIRLTDHPLETKYGIWPYGDGKQLLYVRGGGPGGWRNPYAKGSATGDLWMADNTVPLTNERPLLRDDNNDMFPLARPDGKVIWVSNRGGWPNLWIMNLSGSGERALTKHSDGTVRYPSIDASGNIVAYEFESDIWVLNVATGEDHRLTIEVPRDERMNPRADLSLTSGFSEYAVSPDGKKIVVGNRGELFLTTEKGTVTRQITHSPALDTQPVWLDSKRVAFVTGRTGKKEIWTTTLEGKESPFIVNPMDLVNPSLSPDGKLLAYHRGMGEIMVATAESGGSPRVVATGLFGSALDGEVLYSWSPDSKWLVVNATNGVGSDVWLIEVSTAKRVVVARLPRSLTSSPQFLANGKGVFFTALDQPAGDTDEAGLYIVDLVPAEITFNEDELDKVDEPKKPDAKAEKPKEPIAVQVYEPGIENRIRRLASGSSSVVAGAPDSKSIYAVVNGQLTSVPVQSGVPVAISSVAGVPASLQIAPGGQKAYFLLGGRLYGWAVPAGAPLPLPINAQFSVDLKAEEMALFNEIWWLIDRLYYNEKLNGRDWAGIKSKFAKIVPEAYDRSDFYALMGEMMEELGSSHLGSTPPAVRAAETPDATAVLGVEWDIQRPGQFVVETVFDESAASHPQSLLKKGDRLLSVDGVKVGGGVPLATLLNQRAGRKITLEIERDGKPQTIRMRPGEPESLAVLRYEQWVKWEREQTEKLSGGKLTYLHIQGMNEPSYQRFLREIRTLGLGKKGIVIDVRFNGGGSTAQKILNVLIKSPWLIRTGRSIPGVKVSENIWRGDSVEVPTTLLINQASFSNAEIFAEGFRKLKIGPIIGERTAGGVIGTGSATLWDGGRIRMPGSGAFAVDGENLEQNGRKPDFSVPFDPAAWRKGRDTQLEKAVQELMKRLK